ncbi:MAG: hypothetical protein HOI88_04730 [Phycisphaerae bacterium]|jgi:hypothetical protein|nr:hypothetical protein [Phycisphaerae bacterium]MBT6282953.1 hypothetical protein [Phycisphaerae bacterium]
MKHLHAYGFMCLLGIVNSSIADTIVVPTDYPTIQLAIDAAVAGDIVSVEPGTYHESIDFLGKRIAVSGSTGLPEDTVLDGSSFSGAVVSFISGETTDSILSGFTIQDGSAFEGAGVLLRNASATLIDCLIKDNQTSGSGAGLFAESSNVILKNVIVSSNNSSASGGGAYFKFCEGSFTDCIFRNNSAANGGAMYFKDSSGDFLISNSQLEFNAAILSGGSIFNKETNLIIQDCSFSGNMANQGGALFSYGGGNATISNSLFSNNGASITGGAAEVRSSSVVSFVQCTFDANIADIDCDGKGGGAVLEVAGSTVTLNNPTICANLVCDVEGDFSGIQPVIIGEILECVIGIGACCGGDACWEMEESVCLDGGGLWSGDTTLCATVVCNAVSSCPADVNGDGEVEVLDIIDLITAWGACP